MKRTAVLQILAVAVPLAAVCPSGPTEAQTSRQAERAGWKPLFNGRNLDGWEIVNGGQWTVEAGAIVERRVPGHNEGGWLVTRQDYGDFDLRVQFRPATAIFNTGILIRDPGHAKIGRPALNGFEIKIAQGDGRIENASGSIWYVANAPSIMLPAQEWTLVEVNCRGDHITTFISGRKAAETHTRRSYRGGIGLHLHGGTDQPELRWKDIEIQELPPLPRESQMMEEKLADAEGEFVPVVNSTLLETGAGRLGDEKASWTFRDGVVRGAAAETDAWLLTKQSYANFLLTFDFRASGEGNGGLIFRVPPGSHAGGDMKSLLALGFEYHIADHDDDNPSSSILDLARAFHLNACLERVYRPKAWNRGEVFALKNHLVTYLNQQKETDIHSNRSSQGEIAFRVGRGATVEYRNVMVKAVR